MATSFKVPDKITFSSALRKIEITSDCYAVYVEIFDYHGDYDGKTFYAQVLYTYNSQVSVDDLGNLVEAHMRQFNLPYMEVAVKVQPLNGQPYEFNTFNVIYCERLPYSAVDASAFLEGSFLTNCLHRRASMKMPLFVYSFLNSGESTEHTIVYRAVDKVTGQRYEGSFSAYGESVVAKPSGVYLFRITGDGIRYHVATFAQVEQQQVELRSATVKCGRRSMSFYFVDDIDCDVDAFRFRNSFNLDDCLALPGQSVARTERKAEMAVIDGVAQLYDHVFEKTYECTYGAVTIDESNLVEDLICSFEVAKYLSRPGEELDYQNLAPVIIQDPVLEFTERDVLNSVKFNYRFTDSRIFNASIESSYVPGSPGSPSGRIFTIQFSSQFS